MRRDKPSTTARKVALNIISLGAKPGMEEVLPAGIVDATASLLIAAGVVGQGAIRFAGTRWAVAIYEAFDWMMPGQFEAFAHRKAFCEKQVREGIAAGATQILVLGAGYDTLGWRLAPEFPEVRFYEIDHPATGKRKAQGIAGLGPRDNLHLIQADLGDRRLEDVLAAVESWDSTAQSVVIAEGLTQYLAPAAVRDLVHPVRHGFRWRQSDRVHLCRHRRRRPAGRRPVDRAHPVDSQGERRAVAVERPAGRAANVPGGSRMDPRSAAHGRLWHMRCRVSRRSCEVDNRSTSAAASGTGCPASSFWRAGCWG